MTEAPKFTPSFRDPSVGFKRWLWLGTSAVLFPLTILSFVIHDWFMGSLGVVLVVQGIIFGWRTRDLEVRVEPDALTVRNLRRNHRILWPEIIGFELRGSLNQHVIARRRRGWRVGMDALSVQYQRAASPRLLAAMEELERARAYFTAATPSG